MYNNDYIHITTVHVSTSISFFPLAYHFDMMMLLFSLGVKQELCHRILMGFYSSPFFATAATFKLRAHVRLICGFDNAILLICAMMLYLVNVNGEFYYTNNGDFRCGLRARGRDV